MSLLFYLRLRKGKYKYSLSLPVRYCVVLLRNYYSFLDLCRKANVAQM
jgi:hypothetical protein